MKDDIRVVEHAGARLVATNAARAKLASLRAEHGDIALYLTRGFPKTSPGTPAQRDPNETPPGPHEHFLGHVDGVAIFEMQMTGDARVASGGYILDVTPGAPATFSLLAECGTSLIIESYWIVPQARTSQ